MNEEAFLLLSSPSSCLTLIDILCRRASRGRNPMHNSQDIYRCTRGCSSQFNKSSRWLCSSRMRILQLKYRKWDISVVSNQGKWELLIHLNSSQSSRWGHTIECLSWELCQLCSTTHTDCRHSRSSWKLHSHKLAYTSKYQGLRMYPSDIFSQSRTCILGKQAFVRSACSFN